MKKVLWPLALALSLVAAAPSSPQVEWLYYGGDPGGMKYSPLTDVNANTVARLRVAWQWSHWETPLEQYKTSPGFFESTPSIISGVLSKNPGEVLYCSSGVSQWDHCHAMRRRVTLAASTSANTGALGPRRASSAPTRWRDRWSATIPAPTFRRPDPSGTAESRKKSTRVHRCAR